MRNWLGRCAMAALVSVVLGSMVVSGCNREGGGNAPSMQQPPAETGVKVEPGPMLGKSPKFSGGGGNAAPGGAGGTAPAGGGAGNTAPAAK